MEINSMEDLTKILSDITEAQTALSERLASIEQSKDEQNQSDGEQEEQSDEKSDEEKQEEVNEVTKLLFK